MHETAASGKLGGGLVRFGDSVAAEKLPGKQKTRHPKFLVGSVGGGSLATDTGIPASTYITRNATSFYYKT